MTSRVFVYGTLQPGQPRWPLLASFGIQVGSLARARGALFDTGYGWPAAVFDADGAEEVPGVVVTIRAELLEEALANLDEAMPFWLPMISIPPMTPCRAGCGN